MSKICSLTVLYNGRELTQAAHDALVLTLIGNGIIANTDDVTIVYKDAESISDAILAAEKIPSIHVHASVEDSSSQEKIVAAVAHIGKYFAEDISKCKKTRDYTPFALHLIVECDRDQTIHKSVEILATESGVISKDIARKYGFTEKIIEVIKSVYYNH